MRGFPRTAAFLSAAVLTLTACDAEGGSPRAPSAPAGVTAQAGSATSVHVMWHEAPGTADVERYEIYRGKTKVKDVPAQHTMADVTGLKPATSYTFTVRPRAGRGLSPHSGGVSVTTPAAVAEDTTAPARPTGLRGVSDGARAARLQWDGATGDQGITSYDVLQSGTKIHSVAGNTTTTRLTRLRPGTRYRFTIVARDAAGNASPAGRAVEITTPRGPGDDPATAPLDFRVAPRAADGAYYADLSWLAPRTGAEVLSYQIRLNGSFATTLTWGDEPPRGRATYRMHLGRKAGETYRIAIRAQLPDGTWGSLSPERTTVTGGGRP
ncbi:fibronectin type III domain-containing protein [Streptomyces sp. NPDC095613]|uniref:fibronectin type III domain-containing protein n=1 Tax=Streptomyces sp. NPDC095613 TaxID=3155540 RepID=UPI003330D3DF